MSDEKPLRQEDYRALDEECKRLRRDNERLRAKKSKTPPSGWTIAIIIVMVIIISTLLVVLGVVTLPIWTGEPEQQQTTKRTTACYFTKCVQSCDEPWHDRWAVIRSPCSGCMNTKLTAPQEGYLFASQNDAWKFMEDWKLEPCR